MTRDERRRQKIYMYEALATDVESHLDNEVLEALTGKDSKATLSSISEYARKEVRRRARISGLSTSQSFNIQNRAILAYWAVIADPMDGPLGTLKEWPYEY